MPERSDETVWNAAGVKDEGRGITSLVHGLAMVIRPGVFEKNRLVADDASNILAVYGRFRGLREIPGRAWLLVKAGARFSIHVRNDHPALNAARVVRGKCVRIPYWDEAVFCHFETPHRGVLQAETREV
jgi:hypothetical protein